MQWAGSCGLEKSGAVARALAVLIKKQYQMQEPLASAAERFANSEQTLADAQLLSKQELTAGEEDWKTHFGEDTLLTRVLCTDNNSKAALNWEIAKWLKESGISGRHKMMQV